MAQTQPKTALVLIDIQDGFLNTKYWGPSRSNPDFEQNTSLIVNMYRSLVTSSSPAHHRVIHVCHASTNPASPLHPTQPGYKIQSFVSPIYDEPVLVKSVNSGFIGTNLEALLREHFGGSAGRLYVVGLSTDHCVSTTTRMAGNLGVCDGAGGEKGEVVLVEDATAAWKKGEGEGFFEAEVVHRVNVESLHEFATVKKTGEVLSEWDVLLEA